jgi:hypothetical protein
VPEGEAIKRAVKEFMGNYDKILQGGVIDQYEQTPPLTRVAGRLPPVPEDSDWEADYEDEFEGEETERVPDSGSRNPSPPAAEQFSMATPTGAAGRVPTTEIFASLSVSERLALGLPAQSPESPGSARDPARQIDFDADAAEAANAQAHGEPCAGQPSRGEAGQAIANLARVQQAFERVNGRQRARAAANLATVPEKLALAGPDAEDFLAAENAEYNNFAVEHDVFDEIPISQVPYGKTLTPIRLLWQTRIGETEAAERRRKKAQRKRAGQQLEEMKSPFKCRAVFSGDRIPREDEMDSYSPVVAGDTMRAIFFWACQNKKRHQPFDFSGAYLKAKMKWGEYIAMPPPRWRRYDRSGRPYVWALKRWVYGLRPAGAAWHQLLKERMETKGWKQSSFDGGVFWRRNSGGELEVCMLYVDDGDAIASTQERATAIAKEILELFGEDSGTMSDMREDAAGWSNFEYVGLGIKYNCEAGVLEINQQKQIKEAVQKWTGSGAGARSPPRQVMTPVNTLTPATSATAPTTAKKRKRRPPLGTPATYREAVGSIGYISQTSRPDCAFSHCELARHLNSDSPPFEQASRTLGYLERTADRALRFERREGCDRWADMVEGFSDADWRSPRSTSGHFASCNGTPFYWRAKTQQCVALSSAESEIVSLCGICKYIKGFSNFVEEVFGEKLTQTPVGVDNQSCLKICKTHFCSQRIRHLDLQYHFTRQMYIKDNIDLVYVNTKEMRADGLTKPSPERVLLNIFKGRSLKQK